MDSISINHDTNNTKDINFNRGSGLNDIKSLCIKLNLKYDGFRKINDRKHIDWAKDKTPDIIFLIIIFLP